MSEDWPNGWYRDEPGQQAVPRLPEAKVFLHDLATDTPLPKNLITGATVAATS